VSGGIPGEGIRRREDLSKSPVSDNTVKKREELLRRKFLVKRRLGTETRGGIKKIISQHNSERTIHRRQSI